MQSAGSTSDNRKYRKEMPAHELGHTILPPPMMSFVCLLLLFSDIACLLYSAHAENTKALRIGLFRQRVFVNIAECNTSTTLLGLQSTSPIIIHPAALVKPSYP